jgi:hypothetical protein
VDQRELVDALAAPCRAQGTVRLSDPM